jgi:Tfp pilus assembly PilM family ATPase
MRRGRRTIGQGAHNGSAKLWTEESHRGSEVARLSDITSTEKLLRVIRSRKADASIPAGAVPAEPLYPETGRFKSPRPGPSFPPESSAVGIDIDNQKGATPPAPSDTVELPPDIDRFEVYRPDPISLPESFTVAIDRQKEAASHAPSGAVKPLPPKTGRFKSPRPGLISLKKSSTVGIDIGHDYLRLVRAVETSGGKWEIIDRRRFALPPKTPRNAPEFSSFLKSSLAAVCGSAKRSDLWVNMSAAKVDVHHIRIPRVPRKQIANVVYWTVKKETPFDEKEMLLDYETQGEVIDQGITKLAVMVYTAPRQEIEDLKALFSRIGRPLTGISIVPFSVQNLFRTAWIPTNEGTMANLFIGNDYSRIDIYSADNLVMTRGIKAGMSSMVEALVDRSNERKQPAKAPALTIEQGWKILRSLSPDSPSLGEGDAGYGLRKEEIFEMIRPALERLTRQVERTFEHYTTTMPGQRIVRVYVSGAMNVYQPIVDYVGSQLGIASAVLDPLSGQESAACLDDEDVNCISERIAFGPAMGLALSNNRHTPNLMFTYKDKERDASVIRINQAVFAAFMVSVLICAGVFIFQNHAIAQKKEILAGIEMQIARLGPSVDQNRLLQMAAKVTQQRQLSRGYAERYLGMVLISELAALTPANIRFTDLKINLGPVQTGDASKQARDAPKARAEEVTVEGLILGERPLLETSLASYVMALEASPLFRQVTIQKNTVVPYVKGEALHFILILKVEAQVHG